MQTMDIEEDVKYKATVVTWLKWRATFKVLCDKQILTKLKGRFFITTILPTILYEIEC